MFTPLGIKTDYSILKSLIKIEDYIKYGRDNKLSILGILDNNLCSSHTFYNLCKNNNIKPIIGVSLNIDNYELYLYPKNYNGLISLFNFMKIDHPNIQSLENITENIICVVPYQSLAIYETISKIFANPFGSFSNKEEELEVSLKTDNKVFIRETLAITHESCKYINYLKLIEENKRLGDIELVDYHNKVISLEEYDTSKLTDLINIEFPTGEKYIPIYDASINSVDYLRSLSYKGLEKRLNGKVSEVYKNRLEYELKVIIGMGFTDYFLIVFDYVRFSIKNNIFVGAGRGSAAGSLVAYSLGITWIDPIKYDLLFERFLNPERVTMPDIDIDFEDVRREEVVEYVRNRYGENRVAKIMSFGTMTAKEVLRSVAKINNVDETTLNSLARIINSKKTLKENLTDDVKRLLSHNSMLQKVYDEAMYLEGLKKHIGIHAAGVVICSDDLTNHLPVIYRNGELLTGYQMGELEELGLLKMDFLSVKNLTIMSDVLKDITEQTGESININTIPLDKSEVYDLFKRADTVGVFQFESTGLKDFLVRLKPTCFDDLVMALAIYRPGAMQFIDTFINRRHGKESIKFPDDSLKSILEPTYGIVIYQEQILEILKSMASFSYAEADIIRRAISKRKMDVMMSSKERFITNSIKNGYSEEVATTVFEWIAKFADFGFNKSHTVAYALIAYQMAYLKVFYKEYYYINLLNSNISGEAKTKEYIDEAKRTGINILKPDINLSQSKYSNESDGIRLPLRVIKGVGSASSDAIIASRGEKPFADFYDFIARTYGFNVNKKTLENLILAGVFDAFGYNRATLIKNIQSSITYAELIHDLDSSLVNKPEMTSYPEYSEFELMNKELELFGFYVSSHPASKYTNVMKQVNIAEYYNRNITTVILVDNLKVIKTKKDKDMAFLTGSDETTSSEFVLFDNVVNCLNEISVGDLVKIVGRVERRLDKYQIIVQKIEKI